MIRFREAISTVLLEVKTMVAEVDKQKGEAGPGLAAQPVIPALRKEKIQKNNSPCPSAVVDSYPAHIC